MAALKERFDQEIYSVLMKIETVLINASNGCVFELNDAVKRLYKDDLDFDQLKAELMLLEGIDDLHVRLTFNLGKTNKIFYHSYKEHPKISRTAKFGGEML